MGGGGGGQQHATPDHAHTRELSRSTIPDHLILKQLHTEVRCAVCCVGCVQYLSAGTGITHSEMNDGDVTCRFIQVWISPDQQGHKPQYGSCEFSKTDRHNQLLQIFGGSGMLHLLQLRCPLEFISCTCHRAGLFEALFEYYRAVVTSCNRRC